MFGQAVFAGRHLLIGGGAGIGLTAYRIPAAVQVDHWGAFFGDGISADRNITLSPVSLTFPAPVVQVATSNSRPAGVTYTTLATGGATSYAISRAGTVYAWGHGNDGQIGNGGTASSLVPVAVDSGAGLLSATAEDVAAGP